MVSGGGRGRQAGRRRLFLSYAPRDAAAFARHLRRDLNERGFEVWQDAENLVAGRPWDDQLKEGLRGCDALLAVLSPQAVRRDPARLGAGDSVCLDEIEYARFVCRTPIVPIMVVPCEAPFIIHRLQYVDITHWERSETEYRAGLDRVCRAIEAAFAGASLERRPPRAAEILDFESFLLEKRKNFVGRRWFFAELEEWRIHGVETALLITGEPGIGKSAIVAALVHDRSDQVLAYHCCRADTPSTLEPASFVRNLAAMLGARIEAYARELEDSGVALALDAAEADPGAAFERAVLGPLARLTAPEGGAHYLLVDALDEALSRTRHPTLVDLLAARLGRFPRWLRLVATTRNDPGVLARLRQLKARELNAQDARNRADIRELVVARVSRPGFAAAVSGRESSVESFADALGAASAGNFLFVVTALAAVEGGHLDLAQLEHLPPGLGSLYQVFFDRIFLHVGVDFTLTGRALQVVAAAREPLARAEIGVMAGLDPDAELPPIFARIAAMVRIRDGRYTMFHKSLFDWVTGWDPHHDQPLAGAYHVSLAKGRALIAAHCWAEYQRGPENASDYCLRHLPSHLREADRVECFREVLCDSRYVAARRRRAMVPGLLSEYMEATARPARTLQGTSASVLRDTKLHVAQRSVARHEASLNEEDVALLARLGRKEEALHHALAQQSSERRCACLLALIRLQSSGGVGLESVVDECRQAAVTIPDPEVRAKALGRLWSALLAARHEHEARGVRADVDERTAALRMWRRPYVANEIVTTLLGDGQLDEAQRFLRDTFPFLSGGPLPEELEKFQLNEVVKALASARLFAEARATASRIVDDEVQFWAFRECATQAELAGELELASEFVTAIPEPRREHDLRRFADSALMRDRADVVDHTVRLSQGTPGLVHVICDLAARRVLRSERRAASDRFDEAEAMADALSDKHERACALAHLGGCMAKVGWARADAVLAKAEATAREEFVTPVALSTLVEVLVDAGRFEQARALAVSVPGYDAQVRARERCIEYLLDQQRFDEAIELTSGISDRWHQLSRRLRDIAAALSRVSPEKALKAAGAIGRASLRADALTEVACAFVRLDRIGEAREAIDSIGEPAARIEALRAACVAALDTGLAAAAETLFASLYEAATSFRDTATHAIALCEVARCLYDADRPLAARVLLSAAEPVVRSLSDDLAWANAMRELAITMAQTGCSADAVRVAKDIVEWPYESPHDMSDERHLNSLVDRWHDALRDVALALLRNGNDAAAREVAGAIKDRFFGSRRTENEARATVISALKGFRPLAAGGAPVDLRQAAKRVAEAFELGASDWQEVIAAIPRAVDGWRVEHTQFGEAGKLAFHPGTAGPLLAMADALAVEWRFHEALLCIGPCDLDLLVYVFARWKAAYERLERGLSAKVLTEVIGIVAWTRPDWRAVHRQLGALADGVAAPHP